MWVLAVALLLGFALAQEQQFGVEGQVTYNASFPLGRWAGGNSSLKGTVRWNPQTGAASGRVCLDLSQFNSGIGLRDDDARAALEVGKYPQSCLELSKLTWADNKKDALLEGVLEFRTVKKALKLPGQLLLQNGVYSFKASFKTGFSDLGMERPTRFFATVDDPLELVFEAKATPSR